MNRISDYFRVLRHERVQILYNMLCCKKECGLYNIKLNIILGDPLDQKSRYELHMMKMAEIGLSIA